MAHLQNVVGGGGSGNPFFNNKQTPTPQIVISPQPNTNILLSPPDQSSTNIQKGRNLNPSGPRSPSTPSQLQQQQQGQFPMLQQTMARSSSNAQVDEVSSNDSRKQVSPLKCCSVVSSSLICQICKSLFEEPVISAGCGHTYCIQCVSSPTTCPIDKKPIHPDRLIPNLAVKEQVSDLVVFCSHAEIDTSDPLPNNGTKVYNISGQVIGMLNQSGCTLQVKMSEKEAHENHCEHALVNCPNSPLCLQIKVRDLDSHLLECEYFPCKFKNVGCPFHGRKSQVAEHEGQCQGKVSPLLQQAAAISEIKRSLSSFNEMSDLFTSRLDKMEAMQTKMVESLNEYLRLAPPRPSVAVGATLLPEHGPSVYDSQGELVMPFSFKTVGTFGAHQDTVWCVGTWRQFMFSSGTDPAINVWNLETNMRVKVLEGHSNVVHCFVVDRDKLYSGDAGGMVMVWDLNTLQAEHSFAACKDIVCAIIVVRNRLVTASFASIKAWDTSSFECVKSVRGLQHWVRALVSDRDQTYLYGASHSTIHKWDASSFSLVSSLVTDHGSVHSLALTPKYIICGTYNRNIHLYDIETHAHVKELTGHVGTVHALATSSAGRYLFSGSLDQTLKIWNLDNMLIVQSLQRHEGSINAIHWNNEVLLSGSADRSVKVYMPVSGQPEIKPAPTRKTQMYQACWGGAQLPPRMMSPRKVEEPITTDGEGED